MLADNLAIARKVTSRAARAPVLPAAGGTDARLGRIVRLLSDHAMVIMSGTKMADEIGTSRSEVWRLVQQLRSAGVRIAGHPATGYRLEMVPDLLLPEIIGALLKGTIFAERLHHYFRLPSTNETAMQAAAAGAPQGSVFLAEEQTSGRGRGGHGWHSPRSLGIYCSVVLRPQMSPADALLLSLASGLAVHAAVREAAGIESELRWPNDLLLNGRKFCGILAEMNAEATQVRHAVVGMGINVNQEKFPAGLEAIATSLRRETGRAWSRVELTVALLKSLDREYKQLASADGRAGLLRRFEEVSSYSRGRRVRVEEDGGFEGVTAGLDERGFLRVRTESGLRTVLSGGVRPQNGADERA